MYHFLLSHQLEPGAGGGASSLTHIPDGNSQGICSRNKRTVLFDGSGSPLDEAAASQGILRLIFLLAPFHLEMKSAHSRLSVSKTITLPRTNVSM